MNGVETENESTMDDSGDGGEEGGYRGGRDNRTEETRLDRNDAEMV